MIILNNCNPKVYIVIFIGSEYVTHASKGEPLSLGKRATSSVCVRHELQARASEGSSTGVEKSVPKKISDILREKTILDEEDIKVANIHNKNENCIDITPEGKSIRGSGGNYLSNEIFYRIARVRDKNFSNIKTGHIHIANPKEDAYIPDLLKITIRLFDREEIIEEIKKMLERCFTK